MRMGRPKGGIPWNKGLKAENDERIKRSTDAAHAAVKGKPSPRRGIKTGIVPKTAFKKGLIPWNKGKPFLRGEKHPNWKGGINLENERLRHSLQWNIWRNEIYKRDHYTCRLCNKHCQKKEIIAHHIMLFSQYPELRFSVDNGITLCRSCHIKIHKHKPVK